MVRNVSPKTREMLRIPDLDEFTFLYLCVYKIMENHSSFAYLSFHLQNELGLVVQICTPSYSKSLRRTSSSCPG